MILQSKINSELKMHNILNKDLQIWIEIHNLNRVIALLIVFFSLSSHNITDAYNSPKWSFNLIGSQCISKQTKKK